MPHTRSCSSSRNAAYQRRHKWQKEYPNYCRECGGAGVWPAASLLPSSADPRGLVFQTRLTVCSGCLLSHRCPRCAAELRHGVLAEPWECPGCGWKPGSEALPSIPECSCGREVSPRPVSP